MKIKKQCSVCETPIWYFDGVKIRKTDEYREATVSLNDGSKMTIGVCRNHFQPSKEDFDKITEKTHQGWLEEVAFGVGKPDWVKQVGMKLKVTGV